MPHECSEQDCGYIDHLRDFRHLLTETPCASHLRTESVSPTPAEILPPLSCPILDELAAKHPESTEAFETLRYINSQLRYSASWSKELKGRIAALERENARLVAELARLKAALEWFADGIYEKPELNGYMIREACQLMEEIARKALEGKE
jgi:hypothetical protein